jgi:ribosomal protein S18 acetylase RimI-like enzyme
MRIREASIGDAEAIGRLQLHSWQDAYRGLLPADYLDTLEEADFTAKWTSTIEQLGDRASVLAADDGAEVVGFVHAGPSEQSAGAQIFAMHVSPPLRGHGIGFDLHDLALRRLRSYGFDEVELWLLKDNLRARRFYERQGWQNDGEERLGMPPTDAVETRYVRVL